MATTITPTRIPAALWDSLQEICWRHDNKFLDDASRILGIPAIEVKRRVLGVRGAVSAVVSSTGPWYEGTLCAKMVLCPGEMWRRCSETAEQNGYCWQHKRGVPNHFTNTYFESLPKRYPYKLDGEIVWVGEDGSVMNGSGTVLEKVHIDRETGVCFDDRPSLPPWPKSDAVACEMDDLET